MAPIPPQRIPPPPRLRPRRSPSKAATRLAGSVQKFLSLKVVLYVLLGTAAVFGVVVLCWKLGSFVRQFTRGRILQSQKSFKTRYIKTWYGWVPQDRYNSQRRAWKRVLGKPWRWFSWTDSNDDYSWVWWDSSYSKSEKVTRRESRRQFQKLKRRDKHPGPKSRSSFPPSDDRLTPSKQTFRTRPVKTTKTSHVPLLDSEGASPSVVTRKYTPDVRVSLHYSIYLTYPLHLKPPRSRPDCIRLSESDNIPQRARPDAQWACLTSSDPYRIIAWRARRHANGKGNELFSLCNNRRAKRLRMWAVNMQIQRPRSMLPYQGSLNGCPGSPVSEFLSRCSNQLSSLQQPDRDKAGFGTTRRNVPQYQENIPFDFDARSDWTLVVNGGIHSLWQKCNITIASAATQETKNNRQKTSPKNMSVDSLLDGELWFLDGLDRRLEWLLGECQPGRRGFRFPILPRTCMSKRPPIVYTYPCCASVELMRLHGDSRNSAGWTRNQSRDRISTIVPQERPNTTRTSPRINSWRAQVNKWRRYREIEEIKSIVQCGSSAEEPPDSVIDPSSWILRRPPQGFPMSTKQKNAYYCCEAGRWEKFEGWQMDGK
ncbi:uncharacterized protein TRUGW13939_11768 [Talaromyces rugulosus]|uniref:Uncharacterized protein n=1 Tax=Talaromyces rugulosus TaxID=121627 RepID=A0A7H8RIY0_TALRU|nr:uncharacterized protein TRUGW13939_11768 [Talaromyces rugulosus]QKX64593.1 hypothetical protein TRUGW13939_11768 [Talaromyces rugulosus]